uniref:Glutathione S-transferase n=1 Tax=Dromaius novaehollandiae TaxID=8790 RepID=A0A8C4KHD4_DRONO
MSGKPKLIYFNGRGRMEPVRWLLVAAGVEFEEVFLDTREQYVKLIKDGSLMFQQLPLVEIDGMKMVQTRAILSYIAGKYNLYGKDLKERAFIDMYVEGITDLMHMIMMFPFSPPEAKEKNLALIMERATHRYFPVFEKTLKQHGQDFLVGNRVSWADVQLIEAILAVEEKIPAVLLGFAQLQVILSLNIQELCSTKTSRISCERNCEEIIMSPCYTNQDCGVSGELSSSRCLFNMKHNGGRIRLVSCKTLCS